MAEKYGGGIRSRPDIPCTFVMCKRAGNCRFGERCTYAHSQNELLEWNRDSYLEPPAPRSVMQQRPKHQSVSSSAIREPLSVENYKKKFTQLIEVEREEHRGYLKQRCKGKYEYSFISNRCPGGVFIKSRNNYKMHGRLDGLTSEDFAYVVQASSSVTLTIEKFKATADISYQMQRQENLHRMFLAFPAYHGELSGSCEVSVQFHLKEYYFESLLHSVRKLQIISRLVPNSFGLITQNEDLSACEDYCSAEQFDALKIIVNSSPDSPPILLTGAFGTGKSRLLAISTLYFLSKPSQLPTRILVCTQQRFSADKFLDYYISTPWAGRNNNVFVIREYGCDSLESDKIDYYMPSEDFKEIIPEIYQRCLLVITTCLTAPHLKFLPVGFFSHIFIDEGSHMREPEAVAPLYFASKMTKVVIAGDTNQVGPANLVRGCEARANSLNVSLLQRLEKYYESCDGCQIIARLSHNYRCHPDILELVSNLFYRSSLKWGDQEEAPGTHYKHRYPLVFICSGVDELFQPDALDLEAEIITAKVSELVKRTPPTWNSSKPMKNYLITTPCENQVNAIYKKFKNKKYDELPEIKTVFQGQEYQAVILSTTEPVNQDGSSRDSTKSFCDPYVFNTAVTRAKSLVVAVGNPYLLFGMEKDFVRKYGDEHNAHCWSTYLDLCMKNDSFYFDARLNLTDERKTQLIDDIRDKMAESQKFKRLEEENLVLRQQARDQEMLLQKQAREHVQEKSLLQQQIDALQKQLNMQSQSHHPPLLDLTKTVSETNVMTGKGVEETPTKGGPRMMVQDDLQHVFVRKESIDHEDRTFVRENILGEGGFAKVYHVTEEGQNEKYALKVIQCDRVSEKILREVNALQCLEHQRIVQYVKHWVRHDDQGWWSRNKEDNRGNHQYLFILTELCQEDTLYDWLKKTSGNNRRSRKDVTIYFGQIVDGLIFIHEKEYVHRDLKPSNIFFSRANNELKIGDFGLVMDESSHNVIVSQNMDSMNTASTFEGCGTPLYISPEQKNKGHVDSKTDIYSLGIILFELFYPMTSEKRYEVLDALTRSKFPRNFEAAFSEVYGLIIRMTEHEPMKRPLAREVQLIFNQIEETAPFVPICEMQRSDQ